MPAQVLMQQTDFSGFDVRTRCLPFLIGEESRENIDLPLLPPSGEDVLDILPVPNGMLATGVASMTGGGDDE